jgi:hypothetical protein
MAKKKSKAKKTAKKTSKKTKKTKKVAKKAVAKKSKVKSKARCRAGRSGSGRSRLGDLDPGRPVRRQDGRREVGPDCEFEGGRIVAAAFCMRSILGLIRERRSFPSSFETFAFAKASAGSSG